MSDRTPRDEPAGYEPTAELRPDDQTGSPLGATEELGTPGSEVEAGAPEGSRSAPEPIVISSAPKPIVISSTPEPSSLTEARRLQAKQRIDDRREENSRHKGGVPLWVWLAGGLVLLLLAVMFFASRGSDEPTSDSTGSGDAGVLESGDTDLFSLGAGKKGATDPEDVRALEGETVSGQGIKVQSVVSDEGFWVGPSERKRFFVFLAIEGESGPRIRAGDLLDLRGELRPVPLDFKDRFGLGGDSGGKQLEDQGLYLELTQAPEVR